MNGKQRDPRELRQAGWEALVNALGLVDAMRFINEYDPGRGDYTAERSAIIGNPSLDEVAEDLRRWRERGDAERDAG